MNTSLKSLIYGLFFLFLGSLGWAANPTQAGQSKWRQAQTGYIFEFPRDHASHPDYRIEWWYYTGNLKSNEGRRFGYQLTFFRIGVEARPTNPSRWAVRDLFMAHLAITDITGGRYHFFERINRAGLGWAGAETDAYHVWNEDWSAGREESGQHRLTAKQDGFGVDLLLEAGKPPVIHGRQGISQKGSQLGNASHYYSLTRMPTRGTLRVGDRPIAVQGLSWMDHEFGTSFLETDQVGWDWFSLQFDDGSELMLFQLRRTDGSRDPHSSGTWIDPSGKAAPIVLGEFELEAGNTWHSAESDARYPLSWRIYIPKQGLEVQVKALLAAQELRTSVTYWEGVVEATGQRKGQPIRGVGYLEMTGYVGSPMGSLFE